MNIRLLQQNDAPAWRELRIRMLRDHPEAFGEHLDDFLERDEAGVIQMMLGGNVHGAFVDGVLVGAAGWFSEQGAKRKHIGLIWGMYVAPEARSAGAGRALVNRMLAEIGNSGRIVAQLAVAESNMPARRLYESAGFELWGREVDAMLVDGRAVVELHMWRRAD
jgi:ribosomal protein S18 acetylase RimI-like enzyme